MRTTIVLSIGAALTAIAIGSSGAAFAESRASAPMVRDHRTPPPAPVVRDHRIPKVVAVPKEGRRVISPGRNYDNVPNRVQVIANGKRVPRRVGAR